MKKGWIGLAALVSALLGLSCPAEAQNLCGYAFSVTGKQLFDDHCAGCHGAGGKGDGQLAAGQENLPTDLTTIKRRNNGEFPADRIAEIIRNGGGVPGHETDRIMPVWGKVFNG